MLPSALAMSRISKGSVAAIEKMNATEKIAKQSQANLALTSNDVLSKREIKNQSQENILRSHRTGHDSGTRGIGRRGCQSVQMAREANWRLASVALPF